VPRDRLSGAASSGRSRALFQQGGTHVPGTTNTFGGSSKTEYGQKVLFVTYPDVGLKPITLAEDFRPDLGGNPCLAR